MAAVAAEKPVVLITGAGRGIGLQLVRVYQANNYHVIATVRAESEALKETGAEVISGVEVSSAGGVAGLKAKLEGRKIDILINNAGIMVLDNADALNFEGQVKQFEVNAVAPLRVADALLGNLREGSKLLVVSSWMGSIANNFGGFYGYRMSKAAVNIAFRGLSLDLKPKGVVVGILHPGSVVTDMNPHGEISVEQSAEGMFKVIAGLSPLTSGKFYSYNGDEIEW